ncbi:MAG: SWIM zinc finger family protein [Pirellulaceae bacterium]
MAFYSRWAPYVPVARRRANAAREAAKLSKKGQNLRPIQIKSRAIATSFWGLSWCENLEIYADWENRMPRGRSYARNGSIVDLQIETGSITALVSGSSLYKIKISIEPIDKKRWQAIRGDCARQVGSLLDLMRGKLPDAVLARLTDPKQGIFPSPKELKLQCSCPDYATMCKHIAATLYGIGHLLDSEPGLFFKMRGVDQSELVSDALTTQTTDDAMGLNQQSDLAGEDLGAIFGIDLATTSDVLSGSSLEESKPARKRAGNAKSKVKSKGETVSPNRPNSRAIAKKARGNVKLTAAVASRNSTAAKAAPTKKTKTPQKLIEREAQRRKTATATIKKPKNKVSQTTKQVAQARIVGSRTKPMAASDKRRKASAKQTKR